MSQRQQDIATDKAIDKASNYYNKIGLAAKIAATAPAAPPPITITLLIYFHYPIFYISLNTTFNKYSYTSELSSIRFSSSPL